MDYMKIGTILQTHGMNNPKKHRIYMTDGIMTLANKEILGEADTYKDTCKIIKEELERRGIEYEPYWRIVLDPENTFIDFGSWSKFVAIVPAIDQEEIK